MDFVTWAAEVAPRNLLRHLTEEDDDFDRLSASTPQASPAASLVSPTGSMISGDTYTQIDPENRPLLSPSADTELFLLATNFLLYVAMVIITTMVAKIYFPESLERRGNDAQMSRSYSYRVVSEAEELQGDEEDEIDELEDLLDGTTSSSAAEKALSRRTSDAASESERSRSYENFLEFEQATTSKSAVLRRLLFCSLMLNITFVTWGVLQERMLTRRYPRLHGEYFTYSYALVFTNRFWTLIMSGMLLLYFKPRRSRSTVIYEFSFPSISNMLSSWCQYEALRYVSFPGVTLFKSFKLAPVMAMGKLLGNKTYPQYDYLVALFIGVGLTMFMTSTEDLNFGYDIYGEQASAKWTGIMLLFLFLFFDSFTSQWQSRMFQRHRDLSMVELMFATSAFSTVLSFITLVHNGEFGPAFDFVYRHSEIHVHFFLFSICSTIGQLLIFYTIKNFGAVVFTIIMTTRILLSIALSCYMYKHEVTGFGFLGLVVVMGAVCYRIKRKAEGRQLVKWQGIEDDKGFEMVQEWHEHIDM